MRLKKSALWLELEKKLSERIMFIDGAMGTMIQQYHLKEADYRGEIFKDSKIDLKGNNDLLCLTKPDVVREVHRQYLEAGADIIETNTFNGTWVAQKEYGLEKYARQINLEAARLAKLETDAHFKKTGRRAYVAGALGPTNKTLSLSPEVNNPAFRAISFQELAGAYEEQARALLDGGADILLPETVFDTLNCFSLTFENFRTFFQGDGINDRFPLHTLKSRFQHFPFGRIDHKGNFGNLRLTCQQIEKVPHLGLRIQHALIEIDIDDIRAVFNLTASNR